MPGPDMAAGRLQRRCFAKLPTKQVVFVNTASASGPFVEDALGPGPHDRHRHAQRRRAVHDALRRLLRRRADSRGGRRGQEQARQRARGVPVRQGRSGPRLRARRAARHRARACSTTTATRKAARTRRRPARTARWPPSLSLGTAASDGAAGRSRSCARCYLERRELERRVEALRLLKDSMDAGDATPASSKSW